MFASDLQAGPVEHVLEGLDVVEGVAAAEVTDGGGGARWVQRRILVRLDRCDRFAITTRECRWAPDTMSGIRTGAWAVCDRILITVHACRGAGACGGRPRFGDTRYPFRFGETCSHTVEILTRGGPAPGTLAEHARPETCCGL